MASDFHPAPDRLGRAAPLTEQAQAPLLGVPVHYRSNSTAVIATVARALAPWGALPAELVEDGPAAQVEIVVQPAAPGEPPLGPLVARARGDTYLAAAGASVMSAQLSQGAALAVVTPELAADEARLRREVIEGLGLLLARGRGRSRLGAAGVARDGRAVLLAGGPGSGRSSLCYACARAGFTLLGEDEVYLSDGRGGQIWGHPGPIRLPADAARLFPELARRRPPAGLDGKLEVAAEGVTLVAPARGALICLLERGRGQASSVEPLPPDEAAARLAGVAEPGDGAPPAVGWGGVYRLVVGADPASAASLLAHLAAQG